MEQNSRDQNHDPVKFSDEEIITIKLKLKDLLALVIPHWDKLSDFLKDQARSIGIKP